MSARGRMARLAIAATAAFLAGVFLSTWGRGSVRAARVAAQVDVERGAERLSAAVAAALAAARARADTLATTALVRTAVETDTATVRDIVGSDPALQPRPGERIELFQARSDGAFRPLLDPSAHALSPSLLGVVRVDATARALVVAASAPVAPLYVRGSLRGAVTVAEAVAVDGGATLWGPLAGRGLVLDSPAGRLVVSGRDGDARRVAATVAALGAPVTLQLEVPAAGAGLLVLASRALLVIALGLALAALLAWRRLLAVPEPTIDITPAPLRVGPPPPSPTTPTPGSYVPMPRVIQPTRTVRLPIPPEYAPPLESLAPPRSTPAPLSAARTAKEPSPTPASEDAATHHLVLAWSKSEPTPMPTLSPFAAESVAVELDDRADKLQGRYRLIQTIGKGYRSAVYLAQSQRPGAPSIVALKLLSAAMAPAALEQHLEAARLTMRVSHPNVVRVLDVGDAALPFIAMEYVDGCNLEQLGATGELPAAQAVAITIALCQALTAARTPDGKALVHGALKARNVLVDRHNAIKLGDFGAPPAPGDRFAPEQHAGRIADEHSDVHAVGVLLHELLTNEHVYPVDADEQHWPALPPLGSRRPDLPRALDAVIAHATQLVPRQRHRNAAALAEELARAAAGLAAAASPLSDFVEQVRRTRQLG